MIDGHNLIPKVPGLRLDAPDDEQQLVSLLQEFCRLSRKRVDVYFDNAAPGGAGQRSLGTVAVHFVRAGQTADEAIRKRLSKMGRSTHNWTVVSSDHSVQASARQAGAKAHDSRGIRRFVDIHIERQQSRKKAGTSLSVPERWRNG